MRNVRTLGTLGTPGAIGTLAAGIGGALGTAAALHYAALGLTLSHYDAKAHLVVSRRILDSLTPGWEQVGAVWLPLPHLVNMLPVQIDFLYRTGLFAIAVSIACHAVAAASMAATILALTASRAAAIAGAVVYAANPNTLYLQSTPMTEPMLFALTTLQVYAFTSWVMRGDLTVSRTAGWTTVLACLTRYEAWPITAACFATSAFAWWGRGKAIQALVPVYAGLALYPLIAVGGFLAFSRITVGEWFVSGGFFVPDATLHGNVPAIVESLAEGTVSLSGEWLLWIGALSVAAVVVVAAASPGRAPMLVSLSLFAAAALPLAAYYSGHPFRIRYELPLVVATALAVGLAIGMLRRLAPVVAAAVVVLVVSDAPPLDDAAPIIHEAQLDRNAAGRTEVTACLQARYRGGAIMASMGALGHYMHEASAAGFAIRDFLHEGNGPLWDSAFTRGPAPLVEWVLVEEVAEGGDAIIRRHRQIPQLLAGFEQVCAGGNVSLYQRKPTVAE